jgi:hypothetical protein
MRNVMHNWMIRAGSRLPELVAAVCLILGVLAAGKIIAGNSRSAGGKPAQVKPIEVSAKASSSAMQFAGELGAR